MGGCQSCLGRRESSDYREDEEEGLLYQDANGMQYGSFGEGLNGEHDTIEAQRENEAIQNVVAKTSNNMVDVFEIAPQTTTPAGPSSHFAYAGQGARLARYQRLVSKLGAADESPPAGVRVGWLADEDPVDSNQEQATSLKTLEGDDGALVGTFADAAAAATATKPAH
jgi:hypothetical protein